MKPYKRILSSALALVMALTLVPAALAAEEGPVQSSNEDRQDYGTWSSVVKSYLYENPSGGLTRVEYTGGQVVIEDYDSDFRYLSGRTLSPELSLWGGFFAGEEFNFLIFGQNNEEEDDQKEVIRVVKYDKDWTRLGQASLLGANTIHPFDAGSLRCDEYGGYLYIRTCHEMYTTSDGLNHQSNLTMAVKQSDMSISDAYYDVMNSGYGYISHSFNQFILVDEDGTLVALDHGDAYPRGVAFSQYTSNAGTGRFTGNGYFPQWCTPKTLTTFEGGIGQNSTGASIGGLAETEDCYIVAYNDNGQGSGFSGRYPYLCSIDKDSLDFETVKIDVADSSTPILAPTGLEGGYMLWTSGDTLYYLPYGEDGVPGEPQTAQGALSDCQPIYYEGKAVWYVTDRSAPVFYGLDDTGVAILNAPEPEVPEVPEVPGQDGQHMAYASTQTVDVDGAAVTFECYALKDDSGNLTNYIKLRDLAVLLNGTAAQFAVGWDGAVTITPQTPYTPNGTELSTPYSGDRAYQQTDAATKINGQAVQLSAFMLTDDQGGGYTYYQLRDLGKALGFNVGWSADRGMFIETDQPYDANN